MSAPVDVSIVIPTYGNANGIRTTIAALRNLMDSQADKRFEVILIDDLSPDGTWAILADEQAKDARIRPFRLALNLGQHRATRLGLAKARGRVIVTMDDDLQHPPEEVPGLLAKMRDDLDVVYGCFQQRQHGAFRRFTSWCADKTLRATLDLGNREAWKRPTAFRVLSPRIVRRLGRADTHSFMLDGWIHTHTARIEYTLVRHAARSIGKSTYTFRKLFALYLNLVFGYSIKPLNLVWIVGVVFSLVATLVALAIAALSALRGGVELGAQLVAATIFLAGVELMATAVIGQYVGRTFLQRGSLEDDADLFVEGVSTDPS